jgi:phospholipase/carboxylesterase
MKPTYPLEIADQILPQSGVTPQNLVIFLHGFGSNGLDLISLGHEWKYGLPTTVFVSPHAPFPCWGSAGGYQWFGLEDYALPRMQQEIDHVLPSLVAFVETERQKYNLTFDQVSLVGFSQGAMMALAFALSQGPSPCRSIIAYSGALLFPEESKISLPNSVDILLVHGTEDEVVPAHSSQISFEKLSNLGISCHLELFPHLGHGINNQGLIAGGTFLQKTFS